MVILYARRGLLRLSVPPLFKSPKRRHLRDGGPSAPLPCCHRALLLSTSAAPPPSSLPAPPGSGAWFDFVGQIIESAPVQAMQALLESIQSTTCLPWWASIALTTLTVRTAMLPVVRYQAFAHVKLAKAMPQIGRLRQLLTGRLDQIKKGQRLEVSSAVRAYLAGSRAALSQHQVSLVSTIAPSLVQIPIFVIFALANRRMINSGVPGLEEGGTLWFSDLTEADPTLILPCLCLASTYLNLELGFAKLDPSQTILRAIKDNFQLFLILGAPLTSTLPAGVFIYWLTSSLYGHAQFFGLKDARVRQALGFPPVINPGKRPAFSKNGVAIPPPQLPPLPPPLLVDPRAMEPVLQVLRQHRRVKMGPKAR